GARSTAPCHMWGASMPRVHAVRQLAIAVLILVAAASPYAAAEESYPNRAITMIVPFAAGGPTDILGRVIAQSIGPMLGQQVVVEDVTGAGGTIGATKHARAAPHAYTMVSG